MSATALEKARARKAELSLERRARMMQDRDDYLAWLPRERKAYVAMVAARDVHGWASEECQTAKAKWYSILRNMPPTNWSCLTDLP